MPITTCVTESFLACGPAEAGRYEVRESPNATRSTKARTLRGRREPNAPTAFFVVSGFSRTLHPLRHSTTHEPQRARHLRAIVSDGGGAPHLRVTTFLVEDRVAVVERVERLCQAECVLGQHREFQRANRLIDDLVEAGSLEDEAPQVVRFVVGRRNDVRRGRA